MRKQTTCQSSSYEQTVIGIMRKLPADRALQLIDFARFLEIQTTRRDNKWTKDEETVTKERSCATEEKWDNLFAKPEAKNVMRKMAHESLEDYRTGRTTNIAITKNGRLAPA